MKKSIIKIAIFWLVISLFGMGFVVGKSFAMEVKTNSEETTFLSRGEAVHLAVNEFELAKKNKSFLNQCDLNYGECLFEFFSRTNYDEYKLEPLILYPDVFGAYRYYEDINLATKLALVRGYYEEENSPFRPENKISKIEAVNLILAASGQMNWMDKFEFSLPGAEILNSLQIGLILKATGLDNVDNLEWWHGRYISRALETGMISAESIFEPNDNLNKAEFLNMIVAVKKYLNENSQENESGNFEG